MSAAEITALVTAITALITAIGAVVKQVQHMNWHAAAKRQPSPPVPPAPAVPPQQ